MIAWDSLPGEFVDRDTEHICQWGAFCGNRLYQNKYEMNEWVQEALSKGFSNPRDIWHYARRKETTLHGA